MTVFFAFVWVMLAGGAGAVCRYGANEVIMAKYRGRFPLGTFVINVSGSFAAGLAAGIALQAPELIPPEAAVMVLTGFLGGYTTFSTWMLQSVDVLRSRQTAGFLLNIFGSVISGVCAAWLGLWLGGVLI